MNKIEKDKSKDRNGNHFQKKLNKSSDNSFDSFKKNHFKEKKKEFNSEYSENQTKIKDHLKTKNLNSDIDHSFDYD